MPNYPTFAVALIHAAVLNKAGESASTSISSIDIHDFARTCAFYDVGPVYIVHPAKGMRSFAEELAEHWQHSARGELNQARRAVMKAVCVLPSMADVLAEGDYQIWYTSAQPPEDAVVVQAAELRQKRGKHLLVFGTGHGLDAKKLPDANGWLFSIDGVGKVRHLSVRAALAIYLDRLLS